MPRWIPDLIKCDFFGAFELNAIEMLMFTIKLAEKREDSAEGERETAKVKISKQHGIHTNS